MDILQVNRHLLCATTFQKLLLHFESGSLHLSIVPVRCLEQAIQPRHLSGNPPLNFFLILLTLLYFFSANFILS